MSDLPQYVPDESKSDYARMKGLVDFLSAYIEHYHGGWARLLEFDGKTVVVEMGGACVGCPLSLHTLRGWIEGTIRQFFPDIEKVVGVEASSPQPPSTEAGG
ncbi:MAG TPA: NifU family protein [Chloroflexi bacterium]|nr:NifU family protein [Chloroflexota bacterium]